MSLQIILKNSSQSGKEPLSGQLANGEIALNYHADGPFLTCKDTAGTVRRIAGVWINASAPATPSPGEFWLDIGLNPPQLKVYKDGVDTWVPVIKVFTATTTQVGVVELSTNAEAQAGTSDNTAVTPVALQSKISDSTSTTSSTTIASSTAVKSAKDVADAALPKAGGTMTGQILGDDSTTLSVPAYAFDGDTDTGLIRTGANAIALVTSGVARLSIANDGSILIPGDLTVSGTTTTINAQNLLVKDKNIELGVVSGATDVTADGGGITLKGTTDKTINWVDATDAWTSSEHLNLASGKEYQINGTKVIDATSLGSSVLITTTNITNGTIVDGDISNSAAIAHSKLANITAGSVLLGNASNVPTATALSGDVTINSSGVTAISAGVIVDAEINAAAAIAGTKISPDFGSQNIVTTGTSTAASFIPSSSGVPTNGMYLPAANSVAIATSGTGRVFIDNSGRVGIGTNSIGTTLHLQGAAGGAVGLYMTDGDATGVANSFLITKNGTTTTIYDRQAGSSLALGSADKEQMRIDSAGRVGIGTNGPSYALDIVQGGDAEMRLRTSGTTSSDDTILRFSLNNTGGSNYIYFGDSASSTAGTIRYNHSTDALSFDVNASERLRITATGTVNIVGAGTAGSTQAVSFNGSAPVDSLVIDSSGRCGIGTSSVNYKLDTYAGTVNSDIAQFTGNNNGRGLKISSASTTFADDTVILNAQMAGSGVLKLATSSSTAVTIDSSQRVGIGTTSPGYPLHVNGSIYTSGRGSTFGLLFDDWRIYNSTAPGALVFDNGTEKARLTASGQWLVGTSSARTAWDNTAIGSNLLQVERAIDGGNTSISICANAGTSSPTDTGAFLYLGKTRGTTVGSTTAVASTDCLGRVSFQGSDGTEQVEAARVEAFVDGTPGANDMPGRLVFSTTADGASSPTERMRIDSSGRVGIGTTSPAAALEVVQSSDMATISATSGTSNSARHEIRSGNGTTSGKYAYIRFNNNDTNNQRYDLGTYGDDNLTIRDIKAAATRMTIDTTGKVGIGTAAPGNILQVVSASATAASASEGMRVSASTVGINLGANSTSTYGWIQSSNAGVAFAPTIINPQGGSVGIGNNNGPVNTLQVTSAATVSVPSAGASGHCFSLGSTGFGLAAGALNSGNSYLQVTRWDATATNYDLLLQPNGGRILAGTTSTSSNTSLLLQGSSGGTSAVIRAAANTATPGAGDDLGYLIFTDNTHGSYAYILGSRDGGTWSSSSKPTRLTFATTADGVTTQTERMRITTNGTILFQKISASLNNEGFQFEPLAGVGITKDSNPPLILNRQTNDGNIIAFYRGTTSALGSVVGSISVTSSATAYNTSSDYRLKENVVPLLDGIDRLKQLKPSQFNFIINPDKTVDGFIAHEVQTIVPEAITGEKDGEDEDGAPIYQGIDQSKLVPLLTAALQEAVAKIESLEARLTAAGL